MMSVMDVVWCVCPSKRYRDLEDITRSYQDVGYIMDCVDNLDKRTQKLFRKSMTKYVRACGSEYVLAPSTMLEVYNRAYETTRRNKR